ncbi:MAG: hypothetical protein L3K24_12320 [Gammaproteobacteria bacterium]|nr:hypothetical protein [Gammaproteobacteria bacterium]
MKKLIFLSATFLALAFLCYFLLFISLDVTAMFMESDDDINKTGKAVLFVIPVVIAIGLWLANRIHNIIQNQNVISRLDTVFLSLYGGLFGMVISDFWIKLFLLNENNETIYIPALLVFFIMFMFVTLILCIKYLTKISTQTRKKTRTG